MAEKTIKICDVCEFHASVVHSYNMPEGWAEVKVRVHTTPTHGSRDIDLLICKKCWLGKEEQIVMDALRTRKGQVIEALIRADEDAEADLQRRVEKAVAKLGIEVEP